MDEQNQNNTPQSQPMPTDPNATPAPQAEVTATPAPEQAAAPAEPMQQAEAQPVQQEQAPMMDQAAMDANNTMPMNDPNMNMGYDGMDGGVDATMAAAQAQPGGLTPIRILMIVLIVLILAAGGYAVYQRMTAEDDTATNTPVVEEPVSNPASL